jgi:UDP-N-acetylglucosamine 2-epimerase (non-hydrolysing)
MSPTPKIVYVVGARPNFVKMAPVIAALRARLPDAGHVVVHTGQHYDQEMSDIFLDQLGMPEPDHLLGVGSGSHAQQTARVMERLEPVLEAEQPDLVIVPGDVNSTLAAALVAAKLGIPIAHLEAGLRSFDRSMPEEINRIVADEFADLLLAHSDEALANLGREGIDAARVHLVGNTMIDTLVACESRFRSLHVAASMGLERGSYVLVTLHRPALVDGPLLGSVMEELLRLSERTPVVFPVHPRTRARLDGVAIGARLTLLNPLGYLEFLSLEADAGAVLTDSGGVQEETSYLGVPCFTLRTTTERPVTVRLGTNTMLGLDPAAIRRVALPDAPVERPQIATWDGKAADRVATVVADFLDSRS